MADAGFERDVVRDLLDEAAGIGPLVKTEKSFANAYEAFESEDRKAFQAILKRLRLDCHLVCRWIRLKECFFLCHHLCGPPPQRPPALDPRRLAQAVVRLTADEKAVAQLVRAVERRDRAAFQRLIKAHKLEPFCHFICHWVCVVRYRLVCRWLCELDLRERPDLAVELRAAGQALGQLLERRTTFAEAVAAAKADDPGRLGAAIQGGGLLPVCHFICEWFCSWRCVLAYFTVCRGVDLPALKDPVREAFEFTRATQRLAEQPGAVEKLSAAVGSGDAKGFLAIVRELKLERFCFQLCHWVCSLRCRRFCRIVCPPIFNHPWFTHVGDFDVYGDFDPATGLTNKAQAGHGGPGFGFFGCLSLRGFCPKYSPAHPGELMAYRFLFEKGGAQTPITGGFVCEVLVGSRYVTWDADGSGLKPTLQSVRIRGTNPSPDPPPFPGPAPMGSPPTHFVVPDAAGWVRVDPNALDDGFNGWLMGFASHVAFPGGDPAPGVAAGTAVSAAAQKNGSDAAIVFEATRVSQIGAGPAEYTNQLAKIRINNWSEVMLLDLLQFHTGGGTSCSPLTNDLDIEYTTDHELMRDWAIGMATAATISPAPTFPSGTGPRGGAGVDHHNISSWPTCSYAITLSARRSLTTGLSDDQHKSTQKTFCIGQRRQR
jgi:hypothetical protein